MSTGNEERSRLRRFTSCFSSRPGTSSTSKGQGNVRSRPSHEVEAPSAGYTRTEGTASSTSGSHDLPGSAPKSGGRGTSSHSLHPHTLAASSRPRNNPPPNDRNISAQSREPSNSDRASDQINNTQRARSCWEAANLRLKEERPEKFEALSSAHGEIYLEKKEIVKCLESASDKQNENEALIRRIESLWVALQPFRELAQIGARADPHKIAPFAVGGLFLLIQVLLSDEDDQLRQNCIC
jgi:hypothetical protein